MSHPTPMKAIKAMCQECSESPKAIMWCPCLSCPLWMLRFGKRPSSFTRQGKRPDGTPGKLPLGGELLDKRLMKLTQDMEIEKLPGSKEAATAYLRSLGQQRQKREASLSNRPEEPAEEESIA